MFVDDHEGKRTHVVGDRFELEFARHIDLKGIIPRFRDRRAASVLVAVDATMDAPESVLRDCVDGILGGLYLARFRKVKLVTFDSHVTSAQYINLKAMENPTYSVFDASSVQRGADYSCILGKSGYALKVLVSNMTINTSTLVDPKCPTIWVNLSSKNVNMGRFGSVLPFAIPTMEDNT